MSELRAHPMNEKQLKIEINEAIEMKDVVTLAYLNNEHHYLIATELNNFDSAHLDDLNEKMENYDVKSARYSYHEVKEHYSKSKKEALTALNEQYSKSKKDALTILNEFAKKVGLE